MKKTYIVYTAGQMAVTIKRYAEALGMKVEAFYDNNINCQGAVIDGIEVFSWEKLKRFLDSADMFGIIIGSQRYEEEILGEIENRLGKDVFVITANEIQKRYWKEIAVPDREKLENIYTIMFNEQAEYWFNNIMSEVEYWVEDCKTQKKISLNRYNVFQIEFLCNRLKDKIFPGAIVLDAGSGICSQYGRLVEGGEIKLIAVDPLAYFYNRIKEKIGSDNINNVVTFGLFEFFSSFFEDNYADFILIDNALDHCIDPFKSILECLCVVKKGGILSTHHRRAEAVYEGYLGLHKWNVDVNENNEFIIWNESNLKNVSRELKDYVDIEIDLHNANMRFDEYIDINIIKKKDIPIEKYYDQKENNKKLAQLINLFMQSFSKEEFNSYFHALLEGI